MENTEFENRKFSYIVYRPTKEGDSAPQWKNKHRDRVAVAPPPFFFFSLSQFQRSPRPRSIPPRSRSRTRDQDQDQRTTPPDMYSEHKIPRSAITSKTVRFSLICRFLRTQYTASFATPLRTPSFDFLSAVGGIFALRLVKVVVDFPRRRVLDE